MVAGLEKNKQYFEGDEDKYVLIGGAACDINFSNNEIAFRATRDLDMVLIVEALTPDFGEKFWQFIIDGDYQHKATSSGKPQFFRFTNPQNTGFPVMIELFARTEFQIREPNVLTPIHVDDEVSSLSGILLNEDSLMKNKCWKGVLNNESTCNSGYTFKTLDIRPGRRNP